MKRREFLRSGLVIGGSLTGLLPNMSMGDVLSIAEPVRSVSGSIALTAEDQAIADEYIRQYGREGSLWNYLYPCKKRETKVQIVKYLVSQGADVNKIGFARWTPLYLTVLGRGIGNSSGDECIGNSDVEILKYLVSQGAEINVIGNDTKLPIHFAVQRKCNIEAVRFLVAHGADVRANSPFYGTPLHTAVEFNSNVDVLKCLISHGADVNAKNLWGDTPLDMTDYAKSAEIKRFLRELMDKSTVTT